MIDPMRPNTNGWLAMAHRGLDPRALVEQTTAGVVVGDGVDPNTGEVPLYARQYRGVLPEKLHNVANYFVLQHDHSVNPRPTGGYGDGSFIYPIQSTGGLWAVRRTRDFTDDRHFEYTLDAPRVPAGVNGAMIQTLDPVSPELVALVSGGPVVADYRSSSPDDFSSLWYDVDPDDHLARFRRARTSTGFEVRRWSQLCPIRSRTGVFTGPNFVQTPPAEGGIGPNDPPQPPPASDGWQYVVALQGSNTPKGVGGYLFATFEPADAHLSHEAFGPLREASSKHYLGEGDQAIHSGALSTMALFYDGVDVGKTSRDGPLPFEGEWLDPPRYEIPIPCEIVWNPEYTYQARCGPVKGRWEIQGYIPVAEAPPCEDTKVEDKKTTGDGNPYVERTYTGPQVMAFGPMGTSGNRGYPSTRWGTP